MAITRISIEHLGNLLGIPRELGFGINSVKVNPETNEVELNIDTPHPFFKTEDVVRLVHADNAQLVNIRADGTNILN